MCWCFLSTTEFCCGVYGQEKKWMMPWVLRRDVKANSGALSYLMALTLQLYWVLTNCKNSWNTVATKPLSFKRYSQVTLVQSSTKVKKYL